MKLNAHIKNFIIKNCDVRSYEFGSDEVKTKCKSCGKHFLLAINTAARDIDQYGGSKCTCGGHTLIPVANEKRRSLGVEWVEDSLAIAKRN